MSTTADLHGRHLLTLKDYSREEITYLLDLAAELKTAKREGREEQRLRGQEHRPDLREGLDPDPLRV